MNNLDIIALFSRQGQKTEDHTLTVVTDNQQQPEGVGQIGVKGQDSGSAQDPASQLLWLLGEDPVELGHQHQLDDRAGHCEDEEQADQNVDGHGHQLGCQGGPQPSGGEEAAQGGQDEHHNEPQDSVDLIGLESDQHMGLMTRVGVKTI